MKFKALLFAVFNFAIIFLSQGYSAIHVSDSYLHRGDSCASVLNYDCAIQYYNHALIFENADSTLQAYLNIHNRIGDTYYKQGYFTDANKSYQLVLRNAETYDVDSEKAKALMGRSHILWRYGENVKSIQGILESIALFKSLRDTANIVSASNILAGIYMSTGELTKANDMYVETLKIAIAGKDSVGMASSYEYKGVVKSFEEKYQEAIKYYLKSLAINLKIENELDAGITYGNIGEAYLRLNDYEEALKHLLISEEILIRHNFNSALIFVNYTAGESYMHKGLFQTAQVRFNKSLELISEIGETREKSTVLGLMAECFAQQGDYNSAYDTYTRYAASKDSLNATNQNEQLMQIMSQYEFEKKEQENLLLQQENEIKAREIEAKQSVIKIQYLVGGLLILFLTLVFFLFIKLYRNKVLLDQANQAKNKLFGFIAHDIKAPLGNLQMMVHMLDDNFSSDKKEQSKILSELGNCAYSVVQLTDDLISWSVAQQSGLNFHPENVVLGEVVKESLELFQYQINFKKVIIENDIQPYTEVYADQKALMSIIRNILSNAIKFSETGGQITLSATEIRSKKKARTMIELKCKDEGVGMSKEKAKSLIASNEIESTRGTANEKGSGLGLNLVKEFANKSDGYLKVKSKKGIGTTFSIFLPPSIN